MNDRLPPLSPSWSTLLPGAAALTLVAVAVGLHLGSPTGLWAQGQLQPGAFKAISLDADSDGLPDLLEEVLWLDPDQADSDGDGWSDSEELARASDPKDRQSRPKGDDPIGVGVEGYSTNGSVHVVLAIYQRGGLGSDHLFDLVATAMGREFRLRPRTYLPFTHVEVVSGKVSPDTVHLLDIRLPGDLFERCGAISFAVIGAHADSNVVTHADALNVTMSGGTPYSVGLTTGGQYAQGGGSPASAPTKADPSTLFAPLAPREIPYSGSGTGKICVQKNRIVGAGGGALVLEVTAGSCEDGDGVCATNCRASAGSTNAVVDPLTLIGG